MSTDFPETLVVVSSRRAALEAARPAGTLARRLQSLGFQPVELEAMSLRDSEALVSHWHAAVGRDRSSDAERTELERFDVGLRRTLRERPPIQNLASNPLMCAMICALNWDRREDLPGQRMKLYGLALELLLHSRDAERKVPSPGDIALEHDVKQDLLDALAYWMLSNGYSEARLDQVVARVGQELKRLPTVKAGAAEVTQELIERSGVLRQPSHGMVDFVHRTFLEYMAARRALNVLDVGALIQRVDEENWRETIVFAAGHAQGGARDELVAELLKRPFFGLLQRRIEADVTAVCCLETAGTNLAPELLQKLKERAQGLFPPKDFAMARLLAPAAALDAGLLRGHGGQPAAVVAACVRCATMAGAPEMLDVIGSYAEADAPLVAGELLRAWTSFPATDYFERVVRRMPFAHRLGIQAETFPTLANAEGAADEEIVRCLQLVVMRGEHMAQLDHLTGAIRRFREHGTLSLGSDWATADTNLDSTQAASPTGTLISLADAERIAGLRTLRRLRVGRCDRGVLERLSALPLVQLDTVLGAAANLETIARIATLEELTLSGIGMPGSGSARPLDLSVLSGCVALRKLELKHFGPETAGDALLVPTPLLQRLSSLRLAYVPLGVLTRIHLAARLESLHLQVKQWPIGSLDLTALTRLRELGLWIDASAAVRLELPNSIDELRLARGASFDLNGAALAQLQSLYLGNIEATPDVLELTRAPRLKTLSIADDASDVAVREAAAAAKARGVLVI